MNPIDWGIEGFANSAFHCYFAEFLFVFVFDGQCRQRGRDGTGLVIEVFCCLFYLFAFQIILLKVCGVWAHSLPRQLVTFLVVILFLCLVYWVLGKTEFTILYSAILNVGTWKKSIQNPFYSYLLPLQIYYVYLNIVIVSDCYLSCHPAQLLLYRWSNLIGCYLH